MISPDYEKCGISHYTTSLSETISSQNNDLEIKSIRIKNRVKFLPFYCNVIKKIVSNEFKIIHIQHEFSLYDNLYGITLIPSYVILKMLSKIKGFKIITTLHTAWDLKELKGSIDPKFGENSLLLSIAKVYILLHTKLVCKLSDRVIVLGKPCVHILSKQYEVEPSKIKYIHHGVYTNKAEEPTKEEIEEFRKKFNIKEHSKIITLFGFPYPSKGYHYVINVLPEVVKEHKNLVLIVAGGLPDVGNVNSLKRYFNYLKNMPKKLGVGDNVVFTGFLSWKDLGILFTITDLFIFPYEKRVNASGSLNSVIPYLKPIIVSDSSLFDELREAKAVITVDVKNKEKLRNAIMDIIYSKSLRKTLRERLEKYMISNSISNSAKEHIRLYFHLVKY